MRRILDWAIRYFVRQYEALDPDTHEFSARVVSAMELHSASAQGR